MINCIQNKSLCFFLKKAFIFLLIIGVDRISKYCIFNYFKDIDLELISFGVLNINFLCVLNYGVSFGILDSMGFYLNFLALILFSFYMIKTSYKTEFFIIFLSGLSNLIDRFIYGGVIDFIEVVLFKNSIFVCNFADVFISISFLIICVEWCLLYKKILN